MGKNWAQHGLALTKAFRSSPVSLFSLSSVVDHRGKLKPSGVESPFCNSSVETSLLMFQSHYRAHIVLIINVN